jgi:transposase-like protein
MERFVVPKTIISRVAADSSTNRKRYTAEEIEQAVHKAQQSSVSKAASRLGIPYSTLKKWYDCWVKSGKAPVPQDRGRPRFMNEAMETEVLKYVDTLRGTACAQVTENLVGSVCRGVQERECALLLAENGGTRTYSKQHARSLLLRAGFEPRAATTDRVMSASNLRKFGEEFLSDLSKFSSEHRCSPRNTYNFDEFFCLLEGDTRRWTWQRKTQRHHVSLRKSKLGLTCGVLTSASGDIVLVQLNWHGSTERCTAQVPVTHPKIIQTHSAESHFQTGETFREFYAKAVTLAIERREGADDAILFLFDAATQHHTDSLQNDPPHPHVFVKQIPRGTTHYYQPADQFIIPTLKTYVHHAWEGWLKAVVTRFSPESLVTIMYCGSAKLVREKKYEFMAVAIDLISEKPGAIVHSWEICGISKALFRVEPADKYRSHYDRLLDETQIDIVDVDVDDKIEDAIVDAEVDDELLQQLEERGAQGAPAPMAPQFVENEVVIKDPSIFGVIATRSMN